MNSIQFFEMNNQGASPVDIYNAHKSAANAKSAAVLLSSASPHKVLQGAQLFDVGISHAQTIERFKKALNG